MINDGRASMDVNPREEGDTTHGSGFGFWNLSAVGSRGAAHGVNQASSGYRPAVLPPPSSPSVRPSYTNPDPWLPLRID